jgi:vitamin B12 transporter
VSCTLDRRVDAVDIALTAGYSDSDQFDATKSTIPFDQHNPDRDPYRNVNVSGKLAYHVDAGNEAGISAFYSDGRTHFDNGPTTDDLNHQKLSTYSIYSRNQITPAWRSLLRIGRGTDDIVTTGAFPGRFRTDSDQATWQNTFDAPGGSFIAGAEYLRQKVASDTDYTQTSRTVGSGFAGYTGDYGSHGFQANIRYDDNSQFGGHTTGSIGYGYRFDEHWRLRATFGTAFHAPTFNDLYFPFFGNPELQAERSKSGDIGIDWKSGAQRFSATYFENRISDLIVFDVATFLPQNLDRARIRGGEFAWQGTVAATEFRAKLTLQRPENEATGSQLQRRAREYGSVAANRAWQQWRFGAEIVASGARFDSNNEDPATRMGGYALLNLFASYAIAPGWSAEIRWNNVTNKEYELVKDYNTPGSNVFVWVRWNSAP